MKKSISLILALVLAIGCAACAGNSEQGGTEQAAGESGSGAIAVKEFKVCDSLDHTSASNMVAMRYARNIYDGLVFIDENLEWQPAIATSWEQVDATTWKFEISDQYIFQNGEPVEMEDVVYSVERLAETAMVSAAGKMVSEVTYEGRTLTIKLAEPDNSVMPTILSWIVILNKSYIDEKGEDGLHLEPCGTGPYKVVEFIPATKLVLETWEGYPFKQPEIQQITVTGETEKENAYIAVETGLADIAFNLEYKHGVKAREDPELEALDSFDVGCAAILFNVNKAPFDNPNVRKALAHAMDREAFCAIAEGSVPVYSMVASILDEYVASDSMPEYDLEKAKALLAAEGYDESNPLKFECITFMTETALEAYQATLSSIGVEMTINFTSVGVVTDALGSGSFDCQYSRFMNRTCQAMEDLGYYETGNNKNPTGYSNAEVDALIQTIRTSTDDAEVKEAFTQVQMIAAEDLHMLPICMPCNAFVYSSKLDNVVLRPNAQLAYADLGLK